MRVLVTGSRDWDRPDVVWSCLDILAKEAAAAGEADLTVVHGACFPKRDPVTGRLPLKSADYLAYLWTRRPDHPLPVRHEPHPARWKAGRKAAGFVRNQAMADLGADVCLAFHKDDSPGTKQMVDLAVRAGIPVQPLDYADLPALEPGRGR